MAPSRAKPWGQEVREVLADLKALNVQKYVVAQVNPPLTKTMVRALSASARVHKIFKSSLDFFLLALSLMRITYASRCRC